MILASVKQYIADNKLFEPKEKIIVGVSGGADSVALLDMLHLLGYKCIVAHCNFHLRGEESDRDAFFVEKICKGYGVIFEKIDFDTHAHARKESISIEMAARELRYNWFEQLKTIHFADKIAVAHHRDDSIETILLNLIRGTGIRGLTGIAALNGSIARPLLCINREDVLTYLKDRELSFVEDSTNNEDVYTRNKIRLHLIPLLQSINPAAKEAIVRTANNLSPVKNIYHLYIEQAKATIVKENTINTLLLLQYPEPEAILHELLSPYGFTSATVMQVFEAINSQSGKIFYSESHQLLKDRNTFIIKEKELLAIESFTIHEDDNYLSHPIGLKIEKLKKGNDFILDKENSVLYLDQRKITFPLIIRKWKTGDWFIPFGMKGKKKVSDYFTDHKFNLFEKEEAWLLCSANNDVIWIIGERSDDRYKIVFDTMDIIKITLTE